MTATTVENNKELECVGIELKKAILTHQDSLHVELKKIQQRIKELGEKQKSIIATLRKENETKCRVEITSNGEKPQILSQKTQVALPNTAVKKPFIVSKTEANSSNNNSSNGNSSKKLPQPALAVRTISGQTKLLVPVSAAVATAKKQNQHQQILVVPTPGGGARLATNAANSGSLLRQVKSSSSVGNSNNSNGNCKSILSSSKCNVTLHSNHATVISQQAHVTRYQLMIKEQHAKEQQEELKIPEPKRKETFLAALGLVTKEALSEIQNKKCERKRRTTANPQFSNAAIEAKRITALEMAAKRAKRRMMLAAANAASNKPNTSRNYLQSSTRITRVVEQSRQKPKVEVVEKAPSNSNNYNSSVTISSSRSLSCSKVSNNCYSCDEHCDPDLDAVMFCKDCRCLFHATCASNIDDITKTMSVPCPKCDKQKPLDEEVRQTDSSSDETKEEGVDEEEEEAKVTRVQSTKERRKLEFLQKVEKRENLKRKRSELQEECDSLKKRLSQLKDDLSVQEENKRVCTEKQKKISLSLEKLIKVIELYKNHSDNPLQNGDSEEKSHEKQDNCSGNETIGSKASEECAAADTEPASAKVIPAANPVILVDKVDQFEDEVSAAVAAITKLHEQQLQIEVDL